MEGKHQFYLLQPSISKRQLSKITPSKYALFPDYAPLGPQVFGSPPIFGCSYAAAIQG